MNATLVAKNKMDREKYKKPLKIAAAQFDTISCDIETNIRNHAKLIDRAADEGVKLVVFSELSLTGYDPAALSKNPMRCLVDLEGPEVAALIAECKRNDIVAVVGACLPNNRGIANSVFVIGRQGKIIASYDKQNLDGDEADWFVPGETGCIIKISGWRFAIGICYDASFPEHARHAVRCGAHGYLVSVAFIQGDSDHRRSIYMPARALDNTMYVVFQILLVNMAG